MEGAHVCVLLIGLNKSEVKPPLSQFQLTLFEKEEMKQLLLAINSALKDLGLAPTRTADDKLDEILSNLRKSARVEPVGFEVERSLEKPVSYYHFFDESVGQIGGISQYWSYLQARTRVRRLLYTLQ